MLQSFSDPIPTTTWRWATGTRSMGRGERHATLWLGIFRSADSFTVEHSGCSNRHFRAKAFERSPGFNIENRTSWDGELFLNMANQGAKIGYIHADLGGFRIHEESISGSGRLNEQYHQDCRRIFRQLRGREWKATDEVLRFFYRAEGLLKGVSARMQSQARKNSA